MSKTPGPEGARPPSTRNGMRSSVPRGQTVSKWPSTSAGPAIGRAGETSEDVVAALGIGDQLRPSR